MDTMMKASLRRRNRSIPQWQGIINQVVTHSLVPLLFESNAFHNTNKLGDCYDGYASLMRNTREHKLEPVLTILVISSSVMECWSDHF